jgi:hypothetical protein
LSAAQKRRPWLSRSDEEEAIPRPDQERQSTAAHAGAQADVMPRPRRIRYKNRQLGRSSGSRIDLLAAPSRESSQWLSISD